MLIRGVIIILSVVEFAWDGYDKIKHVGSKRRKKSSIPEKAFQKVKPSYSHA